MEPPSARLEFLPEETFVPKLVGYTVKVLSGVTSFKHEPAWYPPGAERWPARFADVGLMTAVRHNDFDMSNVWLTSLVNFRYNLLLREKLPDGSFGQPLFAAIVEHHACEAVTKRIAHCDAKVLHRKVLSRQSVVSAADGNTFNI